MPPDDVLDAEAAREFFFIIFQVNHHLGAAQIFLDCLQRIIRPASRRPFDRLVFGPIRARNNIHLLRHHKSRIEADAELPDDGGGVIRLVRHCLDEGFRPRLGNRAQAGDNLIVIHADAGIADRQRLRRFIQLDAYLQIRLRIHHIVVRQHFKLQPIQRVRRVGNQLAQEDLLLGIQRMDENVQKLLRFRLKGMFARSSASPPYFSPPPAIRSYSAPSII